MTSQHDPMLPHKKNVTGVNDQYCCDDYGFRSLRLMVALHVMFTGRCRLTSLSLSRTCACMKTHGIHCNTALQTPAYTIQYQLFILECSLWGHQLWDINCRMCVCVCVCVRRHIAILRQEWFNGLSWNFVGMLGVTMPRMYQILVTNQLNLTN